MKTILKSIDVAFSIYSKIPMPRFEWASDDMKYHLCFFPWVGAVIGLLEWIWLGIYQRFAVSQLLYVSFAIAIPLLVTGGFHMDGFLDTMDALHSYGDREKKLEILKDPHVGAFAIISLVVYVLCGLGFASNVRNEKGIYAMCFCFFLSRALSGLSVTYFEPAKKEGMLSMEKSTGHKGIVGKSLILQFIVASIVAILVAGIYACLMIGTLLLCFAYYYYKSKKEFGGITGDLAGCFVCISELATLVIFGIMGMIM